ncbi:MAG TPA: hypothetical protein VMS17_19640 [Gemmataceae bacterium]|nr:hypothetical protein [Gemmataceae bacterium]
MKHFLTRSAWLSAFLVLAAPAYVRADPPPEPRASQEPDKKDEELKWAKGVAQDFLGAMHKSDQAQAELLMTTQMKAVVQSDMNWMNNFGNAGFTGGASNEINEETLSPEKDEAAFRGRLDGHNGFQTPVQSKFTIRLTKDKESGKWRVSFFTYSDPVPVEKKR